MPGEEVGDDIVAEINITHPFPIQAMSLPIAMAGTDMIGQARTGTGSGWNSDPAGLGVNSVDALEGAEAPWALIPTDVNLYGWPLVRPPTLTPLNDVDAVPLPDARVRALPAPSRVTVDAAPRDGGTV